MTILAELKQLLKALGRVAVFFILAVVLFFFVPFKHSTIKGVPVLLPTAVHGETIAALAVGRIQRDLLPAGATLIVTSPLESFSSEVSLAMQFAFFFTFPLFALEIWRFMAPALYPSERRAFGLFLLLSFLLMLAGVIFAYMFVIPRAFEGLYIFLPPGVQPLFNLHQVVSLVAGFSIAIAVLFLLPVGMILLSIMGLVNPSFWLKYARHAVLLSLIFSAIIIPDPSGVTMVLLSIPMFGLYCIGYAGSVMFRRRSTLTQLTNVN